MPDLLQVGIPDTFRFIIGVADVVPDLGRLAAKFTDSAHGANHPFGVLGAIKISVHSKLY